MVIACSPTGMPRNGVLRLDGARRQRGSDLVCKQLGTKVGDAPPVRCSCWSRRISVSACLVWPIVFEVFLFFQFSHSRAGYLKRKRFGAIRFD